MRKENLGAWVKHPVVEINKQWSKGRPGNQKLTDKKKKKKKEMVEMGGNEPLVLLLKIKVSLKGVGE